MCGVQHVHQWQEWIGVSGSNLSVALQAKEAKLATLRNLMALSVSQAEGLQSKLKESSADNRALQREVKHKDAMVQHLHTQIASLSSKLDISAKVSAMRCRASTYSNIAAPCQRCQLQCKTMTICICICVIWSLASSMCACRCRTLFDQQYMLVNGQAATHAVHSLSSNLCCTLFEQQPVLRTL